jgi:hypothetical protein
VVLLSGPDFCGWGQRRGQRTKQLWVFLWPPRVQRAQLL